MSNSEYSLASHPETSHVRLAIVGGGPNATYALERLAALLPQVKPLPELEIHIFELTGHFGDGQIHSSGQPATSYLNRIVSQVGFAGDEAVAGARALLPKRWRPTLYEWCLARYEETGDARFLVRPEDWPRRWVHGEALSEAFGNFAGLLTELPSVTVSLHADEVVDVTDNGERFTLLTGSGEAIESVDQVLFVTGHSAKDPSLDPEKARYASHAAVHGLTYVASVYPIETNRDLAEIPPGAVVACLGMGLTAMDVIFHLTEGRGGRFEQAENGELEYRPSGEEPARILAFSRAGLFTQAQPFNAKEHDGTKLIQRGVFWTRMAVDELRASVGSAIEISHLGERRQLDFDMHCMPIVVLEMASIYYGTLLGEGFATEFRRIVMPAYKRFLAGAVPERDAADRADVEHLIQPAAPLLAQACDVIDGVLLGRTMLRQALAAPSAQRWDAAGALAIYLQVVFGEEAAQSILRALEAASRPLRVVDWYESPALHPKLMRENLFSWERILEPVPVSETTSLARWRAALLDFVQQDIAWSQQDSVHNPAKAAIDGVWRDLRPVFNAAVDLGGLTAESHRGFLATHARERNRLANGGSLDAMRKILALLKAGVVDASVGPGGYAEIDPNSDRFVIVGPRTEARLTTRILIDARVDPFTPESDIRSLYRNLLRRGLVRKWSNPSKAGSDFEPGGLDLTIDYHPHNKNGTVDRRMTFLGPPAEGIRWLQIGAMRPNIDHSVMHRAVVWSNSFVDWLTSLGLAQESAL